MKLSIFSSTIERDVKDKFEIESNNLLDNINFENSSDKSFTIYAILYKQFDFKIPFDRVSNDKFGNKEEFAIKLLTNQDDEIFLYTTNENKTFSEYYEILKQKEETYNGEKKLEKGEQVKIPYINVNTIINYDELCGKFIKGTDALYIQNALQNVKSSLTESG